MTRRRLHQERGQTVVFTVIALTALLGMTALVLDVGSWFREQRNLQAIADAASLAGAQALPEDTGLALAQAKATAAKNGWTLPTSAVTFSTRTRANDTITIHVTESAPGFFSQVLGISAANVGGTAVARSYNLGAARYVAPIAVDKKHPLLHCSNGAKATCNPTFGQQTTLDLITLKQDGSPTGSGNFGLVDLTNTGGAASTSDLGNWLENGYNDALPLGWYDSAPGAKFNSAEVDNALGIREGDILLFPVYDQLAGNGSNLKFHVIGWVGFRVTGFSGSGNSGTVTGTFEYFVAQGLESTDSSQPYLGVRKITLVG
jgi:hypothetical protein